MGSSRPRKPPRPHMVNPHDSRYSSHIRSSGYHRGHGAIPKNAQRDPSSGRSTTKMVKPWDSHNKHVYPMKTPHGYTLFPKSREKSILQFTRTIEPYITDYKRVTVTGEDATGKKGEFVLGVPIDLPLEAEVKIYEGLFSELRDETNWKKSTHFAFVNNKAEADLVARSLKFYLGGAEIYHMIDGSYVVGSKGYYNYMSG